MVRINRSVEYGLIAVSYLSEREPELVRARDVSERFALPSSIVAKVFQKLAGAGIVISEQGVHGGYRLAQPLDEVSFLQLAEAVDGPERIAPCASHSAQACERTDGCVVAGPISYLGDRIHSLLEAISVGELLRYTAIGSRNEGARV